MDSFGDELRRMVLQGMVESNAVPVDYEVPPQYEGVPEGDRWGQPKWRRLCWEAAFCWLLKQDPRAPLVLAHGIVHGAEHGDAKGGLMAHGWVELLHPLMPLCIDPSAGDGPLPVAVPYLQYHAIGRPVFVERYTRQKAIRMAVESGHTGPWHERFDEPDVRYADKTPGR